MEEQRQRQEDEARRSGAVPASDASDPASVAAVTGAPTSSEDAMLERALAMSMDQPTSAVPSATSGTGISSAAAAPAAAFPDFANMTEAEQIAYAMQMSMQEART